MMLLNVCCAPCSLPIIEHLLSQSKDFVLYFYNPNLYPRQEHEKRLEETRKVASRYEVKLYEGDYDHERWLEFVKENLPQPPEKYPENSERCLVCFRFRFDRIALFAKENNFKEFATTLSVSRFKDTVFINNYGKLLAERNGLEYRTFSLATREAHKVGVELSKKHNIYRQKYCGCEFSLKDARKPENKLLGFLATEH